MSLKDKYYQELRKQLQDQMALPNIMAVPKVTKITVNVGAKEALTDKKVLDTIAEQLTFITGQKPIVTRAKRSIAAFKLRQGQPVGIMVTLRGRRMYDFLEKFLAIVLPRTKDFRGLKSGAFDQQGNYSVGISEQTIFPEIDYGKIDRVRSLQVVITTNCKEAQEGRLLLAALGFPFVKD